jgi:hypothetical protein
MASLDKLKAKADFNRDEIRYLFTTLFALVTLMLTLFYNILIGRDSIYLSIFIIVVIVLMGYVISHIMLRTEDFINYATDLSFFPSSAL